MRPHKGLGRLLCLVLLSMFAPAEARATQLAPSFQQGAIGVDLRAMALPPTLRKDLVSGLTNRIVIRVTLLRAGQHVAQRLVGIAVKYDLWEETFAVRVTADDTVITATTVKTADEVIAMLTDLGLPRLFTLDPANSGVELALTADILFDPIEKERLEEIRRWVAENDRPSPPDAASLSTGLPAPRSTSARLFNRIFAQFASGASVAATWKQTVSSKPFRQEEPRNVP